MLDWWAYTCNRSNSKNKLFNSEKSWYFHNFFAFSILGHNFSPTRAFSKHFFLNKSSFFLLSPQWYGFSICTFVNQVHAIKRWTFAEICKAKKTVSEGTYWVMESAYVLFKYSNKKIFVLAMCSIIYFHSFSDTATSVRMTTPRLNFNFHERVSKQVG